MKPTFPDILFLKTTEYDRNTLIIIESVNTIDWHNSGAKINKNAITLH